ncbi:MAG: tripartite tricarboxylate transporter substrate-binding protein [Aquabacterium sp.]
MSQKQPQCSRRQSMAGLAAVLAGGLALPAAPTLAQDATTLRLIVPYPPGGGTDRATRLLAEVLQQRLNQTVIVENIVGVGGRLAMRQFAAAPAEANLLLIANPALMVVAPKVFRSNGYDPDKDYQPVSIVTTYEMAVAVASGVPVREFGHMMAWLRANPDKASIGVPATGSLPHFFALMLTEQARAKAEIIGYKGSAPLSTDLIGGHVPVAIDAFETLLPLHEAGKLRILATSGTARALPAVPTLREVGTPIVAEGWNVFVARSSMPADRVERLSREIAAAMATPAMREKFAAMKAVPVSMSRAESVAMIEGFKKTWLPAIDKAGLKFD